MALLPLISKLALLSILVICNCPTSVNSTSLSEWIKNPPYNNNGSLEEEIQCYSLPYGAIGFLSHILTYYTIAVLAVQRHPWAPWKRNKRSGLDIWLAVIGLIGTIIISTLTMVRCRSRWQFIAIAAWKLDLSVTFGFLSLHAAYIIPSMDKYKYIGVASQIEGRSDSEKVLFWLLLYIPGVSAGMAGLLSLVAKTITTNHDVMVITAVFGSVTLAMAVVVGLFVCCAVVESGAAAFFLSTFASGFSALAIALAGFGVLGAFYSD